MIGKFNKCKIPECVKCILRYAAFDTACSLSGLDANAISFIENYVNESNKSVIQQLTCCNAEKYQNQVNFHFLPGHQSILLKIPEQIKAINDSKRKSYKKLSEFKKLLTPGELKNNLLFKLNQHLNRFCWAQQTRLFTEFNLSEVSTVVSENTMTENVM